MTTIAPRRLKDTAAVEDMRQAALAHKGKSLGPAARPMLDAILAAAVAYTLMQKGGAEKIVLLI
jgi:hypothetical protein